MYAIRRNLVFSRIPFFSFFFPSTWNHEITFGLANICTNALEERLGRMYGNGNVPGAVAFIYFATQEKQHRPTQWGGCVT